MSTEHCHSGHTLAWTMDYTGYSGHGFLCDVCRTTTGTTSTPRYACVACKYDVCQNCRPAPGAAQKKLVCTAGHTLTWSANSMGYLTHAYKCDLCGSVGKTDLGRYVCILCQYDVCPRCRPAPAGAKDPKERCGVGHVLVWTTDNTGYPGSIYCCDLCHGSGATSEGRFACIDCQYDICPKCRPKPASEERKGNGSCNPGCRDPKSVCKAGHFLLWSTSRLGYTTPLFRCDTCGARSQDTAKGRYACIPCQYDVCNACRPLPAHHSSSPNDICRSGHKLKWSTDGTGYHGNMYGCDICHSLEYIHQGRYACVPCQYDICPKCRPRSLERTEMCESGHRLVLTSSHEGYPSHRFNCDVCGAISQDTDKGRYACIKCQYDVCRGCRQPPAAMSQIIREDKPVSVEQLGRSMQELHVTEKQKKPKAQSEEEKKLCKICFTEPVDTAFIPCGHRGTCHGCAARLKICPFCKQNIQTVFKIFDM